jgi:hypothetical protein
MLTPALSAALETTPTLTALSIQAAAGCPPDWYHRYWTYSRKKMWRHLHTKRGAMAFHRLLMRSTSLEQLELRGDIQMAFVVAVARALLAGSRRKAPLTRLFEEGCLSSISYVLYDKREKETGVVPATLSPALELVCRALRTDTRIRDLRLYVANCCSKWEQASMLAQRKHLLSAAWTNRSYRHVTVVYHSDMEDRLTLHEPDLMPQQRVTFQSFCDAKEEWHEAMQLPQLARICVDLYGDIDCEVLGHALSRGIHVDIHTKSQKQYDELKQRVPVTFASRPACMRFLHLLPPSS